MGCCCVYIAVLKPSSNKLDIYAIFEFVTDQIWPKLNRKVMCVNWGTLDLRNIDTLCCWSDLQHILSVWKPATLNLLTLIFRNCLIPIHMLDHHYCKYQQHHTSTTTTSGTHTGLSSDSALPHNLLSITHNTVLRETNRNRVQSVHFGWQRLFSVEIPDLCVKSSPVTSICIGQLDTENFIIFLYSELGYNRKIPECMRVLLCNFMFSMLSCRHSSIALTSGAADRAGI